MNGRIAFLLVLAAVMLAPAFAQAQTQATSCDEACLRVYQARGDCWLPKQFMAGWTPYTALGGLCPQGQTCWCQKDPGILCNEQCKLRNFTLGGCELAQASTPLPGTTLPGYGQVAQVYTNPDVPCTALGSGYSCICRRASAEVESALAGLNVALVWPSIKECNYVGGEGVYQIRVAGTFTGGSGLRVDMPGAAIAGAVPGAMATGGGIPPVGIYSTGWFSEIRTIPRATVEALADRVIPIRYTVIPFPSQQLQQVYTQSMAPNYPVNFGLIVQTNVFNDSVVCPVETLPAPIAREAIAGPAEIAISSISCSPAADAFEDVWHLTDLDPNSAFRFGLNATRGQCSINFEAMGVYGLEACAANGSEINISSISIGGISRTLAVPVENCTTLSFADLNISTPLRANSLTVGFSYSGSAGLTALVPFPDVVAIDVLNVTPVASATGTDVALVGTVSKRAYTAPGGRLVACEYAWEGGCYPCVGADCTPSTTNPIGTPNYAFIVPMPWNFLNHIECFIETGRKFNVSSGRCDGAPVTGTYQNKSAYFGGLGVKLTPPISTYAFDVAVPAQGTSSPSPVTGQLTATGMAAQEPCSTIGGTCKPSGVGGGCAVGETSQANYYCAGGDICCKSTTAPAAAPAAPAAPAQPITTGSPASGAKTGGEVAPKLYLRYTLKNAMGVLALDLVNSLLSKDAPAWMRGVFTFITAGIAVVQPLLALIAAIPGVGMEAGLPCGADGWACGLLGVSLNNELEAGHCVNPKPLTAGTHSYTVYTCNVPYLFVTWFDLKSVPEPDPDANGPYELTQQTCPHVTGLDKWLFNAGWWSMFDFLADTVSAAQHDAQAKDRQELSDRTNKIDNCAACMAGTPVGTALYTASVRKEIVEKCKAAFVAASTPPAGQGYCFGVPTGTEITSTSGMQITFGDPTDSSHCKSPLIFITSADDCNKIPTPSTLVGGKWCARPINISDTIYRSSDRVVKWDGHSENAGTCVLQDDKCDSAGWGKEGSSDNEVLAVTSKAGCGAPLLSGEELAKLKVGEKFGEIKNCKDCVQKESSVSGSKKGEWCVEIKATTISGVTAKEVVRSPGCTLACPSDYSDQLPTNFIGKVKATNTIMCDALDGIAASQSGNVQAIIAGRIAAGQVNDIESAVDQVCGEGKLNCEQCLNYYGAQGSIAKWGVVFCIIATGTAPNVLYKLGYTTNPSKCLAPSDEKYIARTADKCASVAAQLNFLLGKPPATPDEAKARITQLIGSVDSAIKSFDAIAKSYDALIARATPLGTQGEQIVANANAKKAEALRTSADLAALKAQLEQLRLSVDLQTLVGGVQGANARLAGSGSVLQNLQAAVNSLENQVNALMGVTCTSMKGACADLPCADGKTNMGLYDCKSPQTCCAPQPAAPLDTVKPRVVSVTPANNAQNVPVSTDSISVTFSEAMGPVTFSLNPGFAGISPGGLCKEFPYSNGDKTATCKLAKSLDYGTTYSVTVTGKDAAENGLAQPYVSQFSTEEFKLAPHVEFTNIPDFESYCDRLLGYITFTDITAPVDTVTFATYYGNIERASRVLTGQWGEGATLSFNLPDSMWEGANPGIRQYVLAIIFSAGEYSSRYEAVMTVNIGRITDQCEWFGLTVGAATSSQISQLGELPPATAPGEPFGLPATGGASANASIPSPSPSPLTDIWSGMTGAMFDNAGAAQNAAPSQYYSSDYSSFGSLPATGMQAGIGMSGTSLLQQYTTKAMGNLQQLFWSIDSLRSLREGKAVYTRQMVVQPGLQPETRCPLTDPAMPRKATLSRTIVAPTMNNTPVVAEPWPYFTKEGVIEPVNTTLLVTIYDATGAIAHGCLNVTARVDGAPCSGPVPPAGCYVDCANVTIYSDAGYAVDGQLGRFSYTYSPPSAGTYRAVLRSTGSVGTVASAAFVVQNRTPPSISGMPSAVCSLPNEAITLAPVLTESSVGPGTDYTVGVAVEQPPGGDSVERAGWIPDRVGLVACFANGTCSRQSNVGLNLQPNQSLPLALESNVSSDTTVRLVVRDAGSLGLRAEQTVLHKIVDRVMPGFDVVAGTTGQASSTAAGQSFDFQLRLQNNIAQGCQPELWQLTKERPGPGWAIWFDSSDEPVQTSVSVGAGNTTNMTLHVLPTAFNAIRTFPIYMLASEFAPSKIVDTQPGTAALAVASDGMNVWYASADKKIRSADVASGAVMDRGTVGESMTGLATDFGVSGNIYWISGGKIWSSAKSAFTPATIVSGLASSARSLAVDGDQLYWLEGDVIKRASKSGGTNCNGTACTLLSGIGPAFGLAVDGMRVYWSDERDVWWVSKGVTPGIDFAGAVTTGVAGIAWSNKRAVGLATGPAGSTFSGVWASLVPEPDAQTGKVVQLRANATGDDILGSAAAADRVYAIGQDFPKAVAVDAQWMYWVDRTGDIWRIPRGSLSDYAVVYYQYNPGAPRLDVRPGRAVAPAGTAVAYMLNLTNNATVPVNYEIARVTVLPNGWSATNITPANGTLAAGASALAITTITSSASAEGEFAFTVRATVPGSDLVSEAPLIYNISNHTYPGIAVANLTETTASPGRAVWWALNITNNDPPEFVVNGTINLSIVSKPEDWTAQFCIGGRPEERIATCIRADSAALSIAPTGWDASVLLYVQSPKWAADGAHAVTVRAAIDGLGADQAVTYTVLGCGNQVCDPERGEYDRDNASTWCEGDCSQGYDDFRCYFVGSGGGRTWFECDRVSDNRTDFGTYLAGAIDAQALNAQRMRVCKRGTTTEDCLAQPLTQCGISRPDVTAPGVVVGSCIAELTKSAAGAFGPLYAGGVACPADAADIEYYLLYIGSRTTTIAGQLPVTELLNWTTANFTFSCPKYGVDTAYRLINDPVFGYKKKLEDCQRAYDLYAGAYGAGSVCAQVTLQACNLRQAHLANLSAVIANPAGMGANRTQAIIVATPGIDAQLDALAAQCIGLPVLEITNLTLPGTKVGEVAHIGVKVKNILGASYRGYIACNLTLPDGSSRIDRSGCANFTGNATIATDVPVSLTQAGEWTVNDCTIWAEAAATLPVDRCLQAATLFSTFTSGANFTVEHADIEVKKPVPSSLVRGLVAIDVTASGYFDGIDWAVSTLESCSGASWTALTNTSTAFTRTWKGNWSSASVPDDEYWMCFRNRMAGAATLMASIRVGTDNWGLTLNPLTAELQTRSRTSRIYNLTLQNTGSGTSSFNVTCAAPTDWATVMSSKGKTAGCGGALILSLGANESVGIAVTTAVPTVPSGTVRLINFTATGAYDTATTMQKLTVSDIANSPPDISDTYTAPDTTMQGATITFRARVNDPDGDNISFVRACANAECTQVWCNMTGVLNRSCSATVNISAGTHDWWIHAQDGLGLDALVKAGQFTVQAPTPLACPTASGYACSASCKNDTAFCASRLDWGQRNCSAGTTCCQTSAISGCNVPEACSVKITANCVWDQPAQNYSINAHVEWSGGVSATISPAGITSPPITKRPAEFSSRVLTAGIKTVSASVQNAGGGTVCSNSTDVTCVAEGAQPASSPVSGALDIKSASASSAQAGNEAGKAIDDNQFTAWQPSGGLPQWLKLDLGLPRTIAGVGIYSSAGRPLNFTIATSTDDASYSAVATVRNASYALNWNVTMFRIHDARYVLINVTAAEQARPLAYEVDVYPGQAPTAIITPPTPGAPEAEFPTLLVVIIIIVGAAAALLYVFRERLRLWWNYIRG